MSANPKRKLSLEQEQKFLTVLGPLPPSTKVYEGRMDEEDWEDGKLYEEGPQRAAMLSLCYGVLAEIAAGKNPRTGKMYKLTGRIAAVKELLDRLKGKIGDTLEISGNPNRPLQLEMSNPELYRRLAFAAETQRRAQLANPPTEGEIVEVVEALEALPATDEEDGDGRP